MGGSEGSQHHSRGCVPGSAARRARRGTAARSSRSPARPSSIACRRRADAGWRHRSRPVGRSGRALPVRGASRGRFVPGRQRRTRLAADRLAPRPTRRRGWSSELEASRQVGFRVGRPPIRCSVACAKPIRATAPWPVACGRPLVLSSPWPLRAAGRRFSAANLEPNESRELINVATTANRKPGA